MARISPSLLNEYRRFRRAGFRPSPAVAIASARKSVAGGVPAHWTTYRTSLRDVVTVGAPFAIGRDIARWVEDTASVGLRFVGNADKVAPRSVRHTGWYLSDDNISGEMVCGAVYQLPARNGKPVFIAGMRDLTNDTGVAVAFNESTDCETTAAIWADQLAEKYADNERDYQRVTGARFAFDEMQEEVKRHRVACLALIADIKAHGATFGAAICKALRESVTSHIRDISDLRDRRAALASDFDHRAEWHG